MSVGIAERDQRSYGIPITIVLHRATVCSLVRAIRSVSCRFANEFTTFFHLSPSLPLSLSLSLSVSPCSQLPSARGQAAARLVRCLQGWDRVQSTSTYLRISCLTLERLKHEISIKSETSRSEKQRNYHVPTIRTFMHIV